MLREVERFGGGGGLGAPKHAAGVAAAAALLQTRQRKQQERTGDQRGSHISHALSALAARRRA